MRENMKILLYLFITACFYKDFVEGSCLSYGHSCWGAHGKRASPPRVLDPRSRELADRWALVKFVADKPSAYVLKGGIIRGPEMSENKIDFLRPIDAPNIIPSSDEDARDEDSKNLDGRSGPNKQLRQFLTNSDLEDIDDDMNNASMDDDNNLRASRFYKMMNPSAVKQIQT